MFTKLLLSSALAVFAGLFFSLSAEANPRFKVENTTDSKIEVFIYNGDDTSCHTALMVRTVKGKQRKSFGCKGNGKGKCKIKIVSFDERVCRESQNTCGGHAIKMHAKSKAVVRETTVINEGTGAREFETVCDIIEQK